MNLWQTANDGKRVNATHFIPVVKGDAIGIDGVYPYLITSESDLVWRFDLWGSFTSSSLAKDASSIIPIPAGMYILAHLVPECIQQSKYYTLEKEA